MIFIDESGLSLVWSLKRTWAPRGQTPEVRTSLNHHQRVNIIGALLITPSRRKVKLRAVAHEQSISGEEIIRFLEHLLKRVSGPLLVVWDNAPIHERRKVQEFSEGVSGLHVENLPRYAPELNPVEFVWTQVDEYTAGTAPLNVKELKQKVTAGLRRTRINEKRLRACLKASRLKW